MSGNDDRHIPEGTMAFTAYAQVTESEEVYGVYREPTPKELAVIDTYRDTYLKAVGLVSLLRPGGIKLAGLAPEASPKV